MGHRTMPLSATRPGPAGRLHGIDFWRGFILCTIFVNHVPGTIFEGMTFKNFGFSDASEAFVLIAGLSLALAYGRRAAAGEHAAIIVGLARRAVKLYGAHIGLSLAGVSIFALGADLTENADLMQVHGRELVGDDPAAAVLGLVSLGHQFGYFNILPMYVVLMGLAPAMLLVAFRQPLAMLAASFGVYALSRLTVFNVPTWPMSGAWFFDPFAWQFLMAVGIVIGLQVRRDGLVLRRPLVFLAVAIVAGSAVLATDGLGAWPGLGGAVRPFLDLDKTMLGLGRMVHSLSLACCVYSLGVAKLLQGAWLYKPLCLIGQNGLTMFGLASLLSVIGQVLAQTYGHPPLMDAGIILGGLAMMVGASRFMIYWAVRLDRRLTSVSKPKLS